MLGAIVEIVCIGAGLKPTPVEIGARITAADC
jgi:hypothetical protein